MAEEWWRRPVLVDAALAIAVAGAVAIAIQVAGEPIERQPDFLAYAIGCLMGAVLLLRRRWPLAVLFTTVAILLTYYWLDYPGLAPAVPLSAALFSAASAGRFRWAMLVAAALVAGGLVARLIEFDMSALPVASAVINDAALLASIVLLGETLRSRRERLAAADAEREREASRRVTQERLRIAREMHDGLGQTIATVNVQAGLADDVLDKNPSQAREALQVIRNSTKNALQEMKTVLTVLREDSETRLPGLDQIDELLDVARKAGLQATKEVIGEPWQRPAALDRTAYRIVQESVTNTIRHANATAVTVSLRYAPDRLTIEVTDDGVNARKRAADGFGLAGMAERVSALDGTLAASFLPEGGFRVRAELRA
ncbi:sensor histidine kinase [Kibdelosporangium philippinense]|uniref:histidine kinase n=1 Tax=Kibdelosporangium philippinense TaxID=211113 RepID=A0ABS8ZET4_9PSEU|nr:sensor histidine kinase [Kibdelosporangium philippinense]MCE7006330.1 sensor histidine kinase [Kibdelosporangium philippinense]